MKSFEQEYSRLNPEQKRAVDTIDGPVFVMAGPGTGKTQILTLRIANILKNGSGIDPENILALTFTNAASFNMRERLGQIIGPELAHRVYIATFHSFAEDIIHRYTDYFPQFDGARLISSIEQIELIESLTDTYGGDILSVFKRRSETITNMVSAISKIKGSALHADEVRERIVCSFDESMQSDDLRYKRASGNFVKGDLKVHLVRQLEKRRDKNLALVNVYEAYEQILREKKLYDYQDLIFSLSDELENDSLLQAELQETYQYILVDEHQDTNDGQNAILYSLIDNPVWEGKPNVFVVGDAKQSIFRFAGASQKSFTELFEKLKDVVTIELTQNYRSHQGVLDYADRLIKKSAHHEHEPLLTAFADYQGEVSYRSFSNYKMEALWVAMNIKERTANGESLDSMAVLARNNRDIADIRTLFDVYGISYKDYSKKNILEDSHLLKLFLLLHLVSDIQNDEILGKVLFIDFLDFDVVGIQKILKGFKNKRGVLSLFEYISNVDYLIHVEISSIEQERYQRFTNLIREAVQASYNLDLVSFFSWYIREIGYLKATIARPDSGIAIAALETFFDEMKKESASRSSLDFKEFVKYLTTLKQYRIPMNMNLPMQQGVSLMTYHGSKGLEFDTVYLVHALQKNSVSREFSLPLDEFSDGDVEDERRLTYVALTRAKKNCYLSSHLFNEQGREQSRSLHIDEIDELPHVDMKLWESENTLHFVDFFASSQQKLLSIASPDFIRERFFASKLSVSALNNYLESPLLYFFRNLILLPEAKRPSLAFGSFLHEVLEHFFDQSVQKGNILDLETLYTILDTVVSMNPDYFEFKERGRTIIAGYWNYYQGQFALPTENEFRIAQVGYETADGHQITLNGVVDKITLDTDGSVTVWDYKTGKSWGMLDKARRDKIKRQAVFYKLLLQNSFGGKYNFKRAVFDFLEPNEETGEYEQKEFEVTPEDVIELRREIDTLVADVDAGTLLDHPFEKNDNLRELLDFLEVLQGPRTYEQSTLIM